MPDGNDDSDRNKSADHQRDEDHQAPTGSDSVLAKEEPVEKVRLRYWRLWRRLVLRRRRETRQRGMLIFGWWLISHVRRYSPLHFNVYQSEVDHGTNEDC